MLPKGAGHHHLYGVVANVVRQPGPNRRRIGHIDAFYEADQAGIDALDDLAAALLE
jgi:hypothetical protein